MSNFERNNFVEKLIKEFTPPENPRYTVNDEIRAEAESRLGAKLPEDYYDFINAYGFGSFGTYVKVDNLFQPNGMTDYFNWLDTLYEMREEFPENYEDYDEMDISFSKFDESIRSKILMCGWGYPYGLYEDGEGLIYWGRTDDLDFYWNFKDGGHTVIAYMDDDCFLEFDMSFSEFLYNFLSGKMSIFGSFPDLTYKEYEQ